VRSLARARTHSPFCAYAARGGRGACRSAARSSPIASMTRAPGGRLAGLPVEPKARKARKAALGSVVVARLRITHGSVRGSKLGGSDPHQAQLTPPWQAKSDPAGPRTALVVVQAVAGSSPVAHPHEAPAMTPDSSLGMLERGMLERVIAWLPDLSGSGAHGSRTRRRHSLDSTRHASASQAGPPTRGPGRLSPGGRGLFWKSYGRSRHTMRCRLNLGLVRLILPP
jgi:hypothetical protein